MNTFSASNIIFPSKKIFNIIRDIDNNILPLYSPLTHCFKQKLINISPERGTITNFNKALNRVEKSINKIKQKVKIKEIDYPAFSERFPGIEAFFCEAYKLKEEDELIPLEKRFINLAIKMQDLGVYPVEN